MKKFLLKTFCYSLGLLGLNIPLGHYLATYETVDLKEEGLFFPAARWDDYYAHRDNIDVLILGSSHAYRSYDPELLRRGLGGRTVFNFGSSGQTPRTSHLVLEEVLRSHRPKLVLMDVFVMVFAEDQEATTARINWSVMRPGAGKRKFFWKSLSWSQKIKTIFFPTYIHRAYLKRKIQVLLGRPHTAKRNDVYRGNGFVSAPDTLSYAGLVAANARQEPSEDLSFMSPESLTYFEKIKDRCAAENIPLVLMVSPIPRLTVERIGVYDESTAFFEALAAGWRVPYYDYIDQPLAALKDGEHYLDSHHLNAAGAQRFSEAIIPILRKYLP